ncbi:MAG: SDR family oxidoreductase [Tagaea sp.]|nr:SDR family oxidoreductase [Tagaea sp.]
MNGVAAIVIGAGGFVGGALSRALAKLGADARELGRADVDLEAPDAADRLSARLVPGARVAFVSARAPAKTMAMAAANLRMAEAACAAFARVQPSYLLYVSSDAVYDDEANPVNEASRLAPSTPHGIMHAGREAMFREAMGDAFGALRPTLIYGAGDPHSGYGPNRFRREAQAGGPVRIFGEGEERRDHVWIGDVARLGARLIADARPGAFNAVTGRSVDFATIARKVAALAGGARVESIPRPAGYKAHLPHRHFDVATLLKTYPDFRFVDLDEGLARAQRGIDE